jgi:hypothetical protein
VVPVPRLAHVRKGFWYPSGCEPPSEVAMFSPCVCMTRLFLVSELS